MPRIPAEAQPLLDDLPLLPARKVWGVECERATRSLPIGAAVCDRLLFGSGQPLAAVGASTERVVESTSGSCSQFVREQRRIYGTRLLLFLTIVNLLYGVTTSWFIYINNYYLSVDCGLSPARTQSAIATMGLCIIVRPILGAVSDSVPILGSKRRAYFLLAGIGSGCCYLALAVLTPRAQISPLSATAVLCVANVLGYAWCGVILYAIVAEEQRRDPVDGAANLNALQWGCYSTGALLGDLSEGFLLKMAGRPHNCYWMMWLFWSVMAACGLLYEESKQSTAAVAAHQDGTNKLPHSGAESAACCSTDMLDATVELATLASDRAADDQPDVEVAELTTEPDLVSERKLHAIVVEEAGFEVQMKKLYVALDPNGPTEGVILRAVLYIFLTWALVPDVSSGVTYFFYTGSKKDGGLGFGAVMYSMLSVVGDIAMLGASYIYGAYLGSTPLRKLFIGLQLLNVAASALDLMLALRWNEAIGVDATVFAGVDQAIFYCAWQLKNLPVYTLAAKLCPPGVEATLTAGIAGLNDLSGALAQFFGAWLTRVCGVSGTRMDNVWLVYVVRTLCKLLPIPLVVLVPTEKRLDAALRRLHMRLSSPPPHLQEREGEVSSADRRIVGV